MISLHTFSRFGPGKLRRAVSVTIPALKRTFSDSINNTQQSDDDKLRQQILEASLKYVESEGWSDVCLVKSVSDLQLPPLSHRLVNRGAGELLQYFLKKKNDYVELELGSFPEVEVGFDRDRLKKAIELHLLFLAPYRHHWAEAIALSLQPSEVPYTTQNMLQVADGLCYHSGIKSTRLDWYTDRALLTSLYGTVELYMLTDTSSNFDQTKEFLNQNINLYTKFRHSVNMNDLFAKIFSKQ